MASRWWISLLVLVLVLTANDAAAQTAPVNELDARYTPNSASPFARQRNKRGQYVETEVTIRNAVKFCPTMLIRQKAAFFYERKILDGLSVNVGIGKAFGPDFLQNNYFTGYKSEKPSGDHITPTMLLENSEYYSSSVLLMAGVRFYFSENAFEGGFLEFNYRREEIMYQIKPRMGNYRVEGSTITSFLMNNFNFGGGISTVTGTKKNMVHEFFLMLGIKNFLITNFELMDHSSVTGQAGDYIYRRAPHDLTARIVPSIHIGYSFGFGF